MPMHLIDVREPDGPYWAAYQATRERDQILDNPGMVPPWFLAKLARDRVADARVGLEQLIPPVSNGQHDEVVAVWKALRTIEDFIRTGHILEPAVEQVVAGLLGAQEIATERDRRDHAVETAPREAPTATQRRHEDERMALVERHMLEAGILDPDDRSIPNTINRISDTLAAARETYEQRSTDMWVVLARRTDSGWFA